MGVDIDDEVLDKSKVEYEHLKRVKAQMAAEEEALKNAKIVKGADTKKYKKFKDGYIPPPKEEMSDEMKLKLSRGFQALNGLIGIAALMVTFFIIHSSPLRILILENFIIVLRIYNLTLHLALVGNYLIIEINLILLGCALVATNIAMIISFQHKHDKISDRINSGRSVRRLKRASRKHRGLIRVMGIAGVGIILLSIYCSSRHIPIFDTFVIVLGLHDANLHLSIFDSISIEINMILLGCALAATSMGIICFRYRQRITLGVD